MAQDVPAVLRWRRAMRTLRQARTMSLADWGDLMLLYDYALPDGALRRSGEEDATSWWNQEQLASFLGITAKTFRGRWLRWEAAGWVKSSDPLNPRLPTHHWLLTREDVSK